MTDTHAEPSEVARLRAQNEAMLAALKAIFYLTDGEIAVRFRTSTDKTEQEMAGQSVIYAMLCVPRNMARTAIAAVEGKP
jgi:hypothetical protein